MVTTVLILPSSLGLFSLAFIMLVKKAWEEDFYSFILRKLKTEINDFNLSLGMRKKDDLDKYPKMK